MRLILWIVLPPLIFTGMGLSAYALRLQAEWDLNRTRLLSDVLPKLAHTQRQARDLMNEFQTSEAASIQSEDDLIAYIRDIERKSEFTVDTLEVERGSSKRNTPVLTAQVEGEGTFAVIEKFISDVVAAQHLLYGSRLEVSKGKGVDIVESDSLKANITFELILLDSLKPIAGEEE